MKTCPLLLLLVFVSLGCAKKAADPQPDTFTSLLGHWEINFADVYVKDPGQAERKLGGFGPGLAFIFYSDGRYDGCYQPGSDWDTSSSTGNWVCSSDKPGRWKLTVGTLTASGDIDESGTLTLTAPTLAKPLVIEKLSTYTSATRIEMGGRSPIETDAAQRQTWTVYSFTRNR